MTWVRFPSSFQHLLRLPRQLIWSILERLQSLCDDPSLLAPQEEDDQQFVVIAGYAVFVEVTADTITVLALRKIGTN